MGPSCFKGIQSLHLTLDVEGAVLSDQQISSAKPYAAVATVFDTSCCCFVSLHNFYSQRNIMSRINNKLFLMLGLQCWFPDIIMKFQF